MKKRLICILVIFVFMNIAKLTSAHPALQSGIINWGEAIGWSIDEQYHTNGTYLNYKFSSTDAYIVQYMSTVRQAAYNWSGYGSIAESSSSANIVHTYLDSALPYVALFYEPVVGSNGHLTSWKIKLNRAYSVYVATVTHEFGHAWGLNDLSDSTNKNKLMFKSETRTVSTPTTSDGKGFKVITGVHTIHSWSYYSVPGNQSILKKVCVNCDGYIYVPR